MKRQVPHFHVGTAVTLRRRAVRRVMQAWQVLRHGPRDDTPVLQELLDHGGTIPPGVYFIGSGPLVLGRGRGGMHGAFWLDGPAPPDPRVEPAVGVKPDAR